MQEFFEFQLTPRILFKPGLSAEMAHEIGRLGCQRALVITDRGVVDAGLLDRIMPSLAETIQLAGVFDAVPSNSGVAVVEQATELARSCQADLIIGLGGGSPLDTAKCVRLLLAEGGQLRDYQGYNLLERPLPPMLAIPTTAGTGSEATPFAVIYDEQQQLKLLFSSPFLAPSLAILDPLLTRSLPAQLTAATGLDALTHAVESFVSTQANPMSDGLAVAAIEMISNYLRQATFDGDDEARAKMLIASCMAGVACSSSFLGVVHALAHAIGGRYLVHHGMINAVLLPFGMRYNSVIAPERFARISRMLGVNAGGRSRQEVIDDGINAVVTLVHDLGLPSRLRDIGVGADGIEQIAEAALTDAAIFTNPCPPTIEELLEILRAAW